MNTTNPEPGWREVWDEEGYPEAFLSCWAQMVSDPGNRREWSLAIRWAYEGWEAGKQYARQNPVKRKKVKRGR